MVDNPRRMSKAQLRKFLSSRSSQQLAEEILILHARIPAVREYFDSRLRIESSAEVFAKYSRQIDKEFSTSARNPSGRPSRGRQILRAYKQVAVSNEDVVELTLYYVSAVLSFMEAFGIQEDSYFDTVESAFREAAEVAAAHNLVDKLIGSFKDVIDESADVSDDLASALRDVVSQRRVQLRITNETF
jgi:Family of unknown function (DUF6155)